MSVSFSVIEVSGATTNTAGYTTVSTILAPARTLMLAVTESEAATGNPNLPTIVGIGAWALVTTVAFNSIAVPTRVMALWRLQQSVDKAERCNIIHADTHAGCSWAFVQAINTADDIAHNGAAAIGQTSTNRSDSATALDAASGWSGVRTPSVLFGAFCVSVNNASAITPGAGFAQIGQTNHNNPATDFLIESRLDVESAAPPVNVTNTTGAVAGIAAEIAGFALQATAEAPDAHHEPLRVVASGTVPGR